MGDWRRIAVGCLLAGLVAALVGCNHQDADHLARVGQKVAERSQTLTAEPGSQLSAGLQNVRANLNEGPLDARVLARLKWDKALADTAIEVQATGNHIHLKGAVKDQDQRRRAVELSKTTVGVEDVTDELTVAEQSS